MDKKFISKRLSNYDLPRDQVAIVAVRPTRTETVQLVFVQHVEKDIPGSVDLTAQAMEGHEAFTGNGTMRPFWVNFSMQALKKHFPTLVAPAQKAVEEEDYVAVDLKNPSMNGSRVCIQIRETQRARQSDLDQIELNAKQTGGEDSMYLLKDGCAIFSREQLTYVDKCAHQWIQHNSMVRDIGDVGIDEIAQTPATQKASKAQEEDKEFVDDEESAKESEKEEA